MQNPPFFFKVSFHLLVQKEDGEIKHENWQKEFHDPDPFIARQKAFEAFEDYLRNLRTNDKIKKDEYGNFRIISPIGIPEEPEFENNSSLEAMTRAYSEYFQFREDLDVLLVLTDDKLVNDIGYGDNAFPIHSVSSHSIDKQGLIDNLVSEMLAYQACGIDTVDHAEVVQHFGVDYAESGEDEEAVDYTILPTPFQWTTKKQYENWKNGNATDQEETPSDFWEDIIAQGETNTIEFKPSLAYNFNAEAPNYIPLFNNAKTICGFLNSNGGLLLIGMSEHGRAQGIKNDLELLGSKDKIRLKIDNLISNYFDNSIASLISADFQKINDSEVLIISVSTSKQPLFLKKYNPRTDLTSKHFYVRRTASTTEIKDVEEIISYVFHQWIEN